MWFKTDLEGIIFQLSIEGYHPSTREHWDDEWCRVGFSCRAGKWLDYHFEDNSVLLCCEVETILFDIENLLQGKINEVKNESFVEPDFEIILYPERDDHNVLMNWRTFFWDEGLTANYLSVSFVREELNALRCYLRYVTGRISSEEMEFKELSQSGIIY